MVQEDDKRRKLDNDPLFLSDENFYGELEDLRFFVELGEPALSGELRIPSFIDLSLVHPNSDQEKLVVATDVAQISEKTTEEM